MATDLRDLTTVANLQAWLGSSNAAPDVLAQLQRVVTAVSVWIQSWLSRSIASQGYSDVYNGHGGARLVLSNYPVTAVASVVIDGAAVPPSTGPTVPGWFLANDEVILRGYRFNRGAGNVEIAYTAGYAVVPPELEQACLELAAMRWKERDRIGHASTVMAGQQTNFIIKDMPPSVATILNQWKKVVPC